MKSLLFVALITCCIFISSCQTFEYSDAPEVVQMAIKVKHPNEKKPDFAQDEQAFVSLF